MNEDTLAELRAVLRGTAFGPDDDGYEEARRVWNGTIDKRPTLIVRCRGVADVIDAVKYASSNSLPISIRGGGHHVAGSSIIEAGLVIDLSQMRSVRVDPATGRVRAEGGALIGDVDREAQAFGLAVPLGLFSPTGIAGITLAGGLGWMRRKLGMSCDNLISADVVSAEGRVLKASGSENADLFWALRGGGWDLGVVTSFEYQAHPVGPDVFFQLTAYPLNEAKQVLQRMRDYMATAPDEVAPIAIIWTFAESEPYPREVWGKPFIGIAGTYAGTVADGERALQPLRELATPMLDMSSPMPYLTMQHLFDEEYPNGRRYYWKSSYLGGLSDEAIDAIIDAGNKRPSPLTSVDVWSLGGAIARPSATDTPIGQRQAPYLIGLESNWEGTDGDAPNIAWAREAAQALAPFSTGGSYLNFEDLSERDATAASYGANFQRLVSVKRKYDPTNLFRSRRGLVD